MSCLGEKLGEIELSVKMRTIPLPGQEDPMKLYCHLVLAPGFARVE